MRFQGFAFAIGCVCAGHIAGGAARAARARCGVQPLAGEPVAAGAKQGRFAQDLQRRHPRARARPDAARSRTAGPQGAAAAPAGRVRADPVRLHPRTVDLPACRPRQEARGGASRDVGQNRATLRRAAQHHPRDLGPRDRLWRTQAAAQRHPRAGDAGLLRPAQGHVPRRAALRIQDPGRGARHARQDAQLLGRRDGPHAIPAVGVLQARGRFRRRRSPRHLGLDSGRARVSRAAARQQGLEARPALGL